jgi:hypothetical protein
LPKKPVGFSACDITNQSLYEGLFKFNYLFLLKVAS